MLSGVASPEVPPATQAGQWPGVEKERHMQGRETMQWQVTCLCGWRVRGTKEDVVRAVQEHGRSVHQLETSEEEVMALAVPAEGT